MVTPSCTRVCLAGTFLSLKCGSKYSLAIERHKAFIILLSSQTETWHPSPYIEKVVRFIGINIHTHNKGASLIDGRIPEIFEAHVHF